jgi:hypothetical protein
MARAGLEPEWRCLLANDVDPRTGGATPPFWRAICLRAPGGGSSRQFLIVVDDNESGRDCWPTRGGKTHGYRVV